MEGLGQRAARNADGKTYYVPSDMSYNDWKEKYVVKNETKNKLKLEQYADNVDNSAKSGIINTTKSEWDNDLPPRGQVNEKIAEDELYDFVANELEISNEQASEYVDSVMGYTDASSDIYSEVRRYQRGEQTQFLPLEETKKLSDNIEDYIKKAPRWNGGSTFRGYSVSDVELSAYKPGYEFDMGGTASWTGTQGIAKDFATRNTSGDRPNSVICHCDTQYKGTGIKHISVYEFEDEVLCSKESRYVVDRVTIDSEYIYHLYVKEV